MKVLQAAMEAGADEYLSKPLCTERFRECVAALMQGDDRGG